VKRLGLPYNRPVQSQASDVVALPAFEDPLMQWYGALAARDIAVTRLVWNDQGRGPTLVQFKYRKRPCSLNGLFELGVPRDPVGVGNRVHAAIAMGYAMGAQHPTLNPEVEDVARSDRLGTVRATIDGVRVPEVRWHTRDRRGSEGAVMVADQEWQVTQFTGGGSRAQAHVGADPDDVLARLCAAVEAFEAGTVNTEVSARVRGTSRTFRRKL
jgi:hypothetical protein